MSVSGATTSGKGGGAATEVFFLSLATDSYSPHFQGVPTELASGAVTGRRRYSASGVSTEGGGHHD